MKKLVLTIAAAGFMLSAQAQKGNISKANNMLAIRQYDKALELINPAVESADTKDKDKPEAWFTRGEVYLQMQGDTAYAKQHPGNYYLEAGKSYMKVAELKKDYENLPARIMTVAFYSFNEGQKAQYDDKNYQAAYDAFGLTGSIYDMNLAWSDADKKQFADVAAKAKLQQALAARELKKSDEEAKLLEGIKKDTSVTQPYVYLRLNEIYMDKKDEAAALAILEEGKKQFPENKDLVNTEINYYIRTGKQDMLTKKMEEAVAANPNSPELQYNLGNGYMGAAFPTGGKAPANQAELIEKAEKAYTAALASKPDVPEYSYNMGTLFYQQAFNFNKQMNAITGMSAAEQKKYDALKVQRNNLFGKAQPYLEKVVTLLEPKKDQLSPEDKDTYSNSLRGLRDIYDVTGQKEKLTAIKTKIDTKK